MPQSDILKIEGLTVKYGDLTAVDNLSLTVQQGDVFGFIGPNGAGKTTTIRVMATLLAPTKGRVLINGHDVITHPDEVKRCIGYMPDFFGVYNNLKVWEYLTFFGKVFDVPDDILSLRIDEVLDITKLSVKRNGYVEALSRGMKQRLCLARTLLQEPKIFILDEPASGLDPHARIEIRELIKNLAENGKTIFISSHILADLTDICTHIGIIELGRLVCYGQKDEMLKNSQQVRSLRIKSLNPGKCCDILNNFNGISYIKNEQGSYLVNITDNDVLTAKLIHELVQQGAQPISVSEEKRDLEDLFLNTTRGEVK